MFNVFCDLGYQFPANKRRWLNVVLMLARRLRRRPNIKTTLGQRLVFAENVLVPSMLYIWIPSCPRQHDMPRLSLHICCGADITDGGPASNHHKLKSPVCQPVYSNTQSYTYIYILRSLINLTFREDCLYHHVRWPVSTFTHVCQVLSL